LYIQNILKNTYFDVLKDVIKNFKISISRYFKWSTKTTSKFQQENIDSFNKSLIASNMIIN